MQPTCFNAAYTDVCMVCDATKGMIDNELRMGKGNTRRVIKNGQVLIVKPDGTVYNMAGARMY